MYVTSAKEATQSGPAPIALNPTPINQHKICTPLRPQNFARLLHNHPDQAFVSKLITSLQIGFDIGYSGPHLPLVAPNLHSASVYPHIVDEALEKEIQANRIAGPYPFPPFHNLRCSGLGVVPKKDGGWRLIYHLSAPTNQSINDYIDPTTYSLQYSTIDDAIKMCHKVGKGALLDKVDLKNAFRLCPVRPDDICSEFVGVVTSTLISVYHLAYARRHSSSTWLLTRLSGSCDIISTNSIVFTIWTIFS